MLCTDHFWDVCKQLKSNYRVGGVGGGLDLLEKLKEQKKTGPLWSSSVASPVNPCLFRPLVGWGLIHYRDT